MSADKTALLVVDAQHFYQPILRDRLPFIERLVIHFRSQGLPIIFTQQGTLPATLRARPCPSRLVAHWGAERCIEHGSEEWQFVLGIKEMVNSSKGPRPASTALTARDYTSAAEASTGRKDRKNHDQTVVHKETYDAFLGAVPAGDLAHGGKPLEQLLRDKGVARVVVCGAMTDCAVDTTARSAWGRGFETWIVGDACATATKVQHENALSAWRFGFGDVVRTEDLVVRY